MRRARIRGRARRSWLAPLFMPVPIDDRRGIAGAPPAASNAASVVARAAASAFEKFAIVACFASAAANFLASAAASALEKLAVAAAAAAAFDISADTRILPTAAAAAAAAGSVCRMSMRMSMDPRRDVLPSSRAGPPLSDPRRRLSERRRPRFGDANAVASPRAAAAAASSSSASSASTGAVGGFIGPPTFAVIRTSPLKII